MSGKIAVQKRPYHRNVPDEWLHAGETGWRGAFDFPAGSLDLAALQGAIAAVAPLIAARERERIVGDMLAVAFGLRDIESSTEVPLYTRQHAAAAAHALEMRAVAIRAQELGA